MRTAYGVTVSISGNYGASKWINAFALLIIALEINYGINSLGADVFFWITVVVGALIVIVDQRNTWSFLLTSGTEPFVRVMVEAESQETADAVAQGLAEVALQHFCGGR